MNRANTRRGKKAVALSEVLEPGLTEAVRRGEGEKWLRRNRAALEAHNAKVEKHGVFSEGLRSF